MFELKYSQNFLKSSRLVQTILSISNITKQDTVYEIGPGKGIITTVLCEKSKKVIAVEFDQQLYIKLNHNIGYYPNLKLLNMDFLKLPLPTYDYKVVSNIPFHITAKIIHKLTNWENAPTDSFLIMQKEAALKYIGVNNKQTLQSLLLKPLFDINILHRFKRNDFQPIPNVDIVFVHIKRKEYVKEYIQYRDFLAFVYNTQKATIKSSFKHVLSYQQIKRLAKVYQFDLMKPLTSLTHEPFFSVFLFFDKVADNNKKSQIKGSYQLYLDNQNKLNKRHRSYL